jgi:hypothetical protein
VPELAPEEVADPASDQIGDGFANCRLTYWTTLLFPLAVIARTLGGSSTGRDFHSAADSIPHRLFKHIMALELRLLKRTSLPIGVALFAKARKAAGKRNGIQSESNVSADS